MTNSIIVPSEHKTFGDVKTGVYIYRPPLKESPRLTVDIPLDTPAEQLDWLRGALGPRKKYTLSADGWQMRSYLLRKLEYAAVQDFGLCRVRFEYYKKEACTRRCQEGKIENAWSCSCVCAGSRHGGENFTDWDFTTLDGEYLCDWERQVNIYEITWQDGRVNL